MRVLAPRCVGQVGWNRNAAVWAITRAARREQLRQRNLTLRAWVRGGSAQDHDRQALQAGLLLQIQGLPREAGALAAWLLPERSRGERLRTSRIGLSGPWISRASLLLPRLLMPPLLVGGAVT